MIISNLNGVDRVNLNEFSKQTFNNMYDFHESLLLSKYLKNTDLTGFFELIYFLSFPQRNMRYIFFPLDLYGYSILNLTTQTAYHYVPEVSTGGETFIWTDVAYSGTDKIAVEGCYWACPYKFEIYDFTEPEKLPYPLLFRQEDIEPDNMNELEFDGWVSPNEYAYVEEIKIDERTYENVRKSVKFE